MAKIGRVADVQLIAAAWEASRGGGVFAALTAKPTTSLLDSAVLMLNAHYTALRVVSARRAFTLLLKRDECARPLAEVIHVEDGEYVSYDFAHWIDLSVARFHRTTGFDFIQTVRFPVAVPRIVRVLSFGKLHRQEVKFSRRNVFARDNHICQYCNDRFGSSDLSLDHVVPRSRGGLSTWENVVTSCVRCNVRKGGRTPDEARMKLQRRPEKPRRCPLLISKLAEQRYATWQPFLSAAM